MLKIPAANRVQLRHKGREYGISLRVRGTGDTGIVFIHGWGCQQDSFEGAFSYPGFKVLTISTFDLLGHGASDKPDGFSYEMEDHAATTLQVIHHLGLTKVHLVGHSMGGLVGLLVAQKLGDRLISLVTAEGNLVPEDAGEGVRLIAKQPLSVFKAAGFRAAQVMMARSDEPATRRRAQWWGEASPEAVYKNGKSIVRWSDSGKLLPIYQAIPSRMYVVGERSDKQATVSQLDPREVKQIPGSGHFMMLDNPRGFYDAVALMLS